MTEKRLLDAIHKANPSAALFRNDCGTTFAGKPSKLTGNRVLIRDAKFIRYGLQPGSADLIGWTPIIITPDMVGQTVAVFTSIEAKTDNDTIKPDQVQWARSVQRDGGIAKIVRSVGDRLIDEPV